MIEPLKYPKDAAIYKLTCAHNNKIYIGKGINLYKRLASHKYSSKRLMGRSLIENAMIKHGWDSFDVEILEIFENINGAEDNYFILERESYYIELFDATNIIKGYNVCKKSTDRTGLKHSEETKRRMSMSRTGRKHSDETKEKIRKSLTGHKQCDETKDKRSKHMERLRIMNTGRVVSDETREKSSDSHKGKGKGRKVSKATREKISKGLKEYYLRVG